VMLPIGLGPTGGPLRILCLGAHSDDIEIGCGGTLLRLLAERPGSTVDWVVFSATPERELESRASSSDFLRGAAKTSLRVERFRESFFPAAYSEIKECLGDVRRSVEPDLVFSHRHRDRHQDHRIIGELTWNAFRNHAIFEYEVAKWEGDLGQPNLFVPLSRAIADRKVELLAKHFASQADKPWFKPDTFHGLMSIRAVECHAPEGRAEAFHASKLIV
jgi:LmbE family N-acetylglucosaminyl deacetylase